MILKVVCILFLLITNVFAFETTAKQAILMDFDSNEVLYTKNADERAFPSSMTKIMTAYLIFEKLNEGKLGLQDKFQVSSEAWRQEGSRMFLNVGSQVSVDNLLMGLLVVSGNDAAVALADGASGTVEEFVGQMNKKAKELGLRNTNFTNPIGLSEANHYMSMRDIAILSQNLIKNLPNYYNQYFSVMEFTHNNIKQPNRNLLLGKFDGVDGIKTGHTNAAGYGIALSAKQGDRRLIAVINGLNSEAERAEEGKKILSYGFNDLSKYKLYRKNEIIKTIPVLYGKNKNANIIVNQDIFATSDNIDNISVDIAIKKLEAPLSANQRVGTLTIKSLENVARYDLLNKNKIEQVNIFMKFLLKVSIYFKN